MLLAVGEAAAGKASRSLAQHIPGQGGLEGMKVAAGGAVGDLARARIALDERGQRLGELEERTALMMSSAETFSKHAHEVKQRKEKNFSIQSKKTLHFTKHCDSCGFTVDAEVQGQKVVPVLKAEGALDQEDGTLGKESIYEQRVKTESLGFCCGRTGCVALSLYYTTGTRRSPRPDTTCTGED